MLTPAKYWRVPCAITSESPPPPAEFLLPITLANQNSPPRRGHGLMLAAYDEDQQTGLLRWVGMITDCAGANCQVDWRSTNAQIWVDSPAGRGFWRSGAFAFAAGKIADYGLHELWQQHFEGLELRNHARLISRPAGSRVRTSKIAPERLTPMEIIGEPTIGPRAGVVYVLKSAYGYKVGRTRDIPTRMRAFGVQLPFIYSIVTCVWFDDCHVAERRYHDVFAGKRINGEWFDLEPADIEMIRAKQ